MDVLNRDGTSAVHYLVRAQGLLFCCDGREKKRER